MNTPLLSFPLLALPLLLAACGGSGEPETVPPPTCSRFVSAAALRVSSVNPSAVRAPDWSAERMPGRVLILEDHTRLVAQNLRVLSTIRTQRISPNLTLALTPAGQGDQAFASTLSAAGLQVQPDFVYSSLALPNDPGFPGNQGIAVQNVTLTQTYLTRVNAAGAWNYLESCGAAPVGALTAVLDSGADATHVDLKDRLLPGQSFVDTPANTDELGHGTGVAGLIGAATNNAVGLAGMTWSGRTVLPIKVLDAAGNTSTSDLTQGLNAAVAQRVKVINMSLGIPGDPGDAALDTALNAAAQTAVLVAAAGNTRGEGVYYPASNPNVIAVGAVGSSDTQLACYSARPNDTLTRRLDLVAPGGAGVDVCDDAQAGQDHLVLAPDNRYTTTAGTSEAAPLVSGVAALMRAANPDLTAPQTRALLLSSARVSGGLPLLDANAAVRAVLRK